MPKLYEYRGILIHFYSNEHEPFHVHGRHAGRERRAEITLENGRITHIEFSDVAGKRPLEGPKRKDFEEFVEAKAEEMFSGGSTFLSGTSEQDRRSSRVESNENNN